MNRMFIYTVHRPSEVLAKVQKGPDSRFYGTVFEYIRQELEHRPVWPVPPQRPEMKIMQAKVEDFVKRLACNQEDRFVEGIIQGTLLKRWNPMRTIMFCNKPQNERWRHGLQSMMMVLRNDDENVKIDYVNGFLQCQFRKSEKVQDYYWTFGEERKPKLHSVEDLGDECVAANYKKGDSH